MHVNHQLLLEALKYYGTKEIPGDRNNPSILKFFAIAGHQWVNSETTPWCSAFMCYVARQVKAEDTGSLRARSWMSVRDAKSVLRIDDLIPGDITILWRGQKDSAQGHVALYVNSDDHYLYLLGGNQSNSVCIKRYPRYRFLEGRRLIAQPI